MIVLRKILAAPILIVLALLSAFVSFLVCVVAAVGFAACVILVLLALVLLVTGQAVGAAVLLVLAHKVGKENFTFVFSAMAPLFAVAVILL